VKIDVMGDWVRFAFFTFLKAATSCSWPSANEKTKVRGKRAKKRLRKIGGVF
jgi:hypothetical protein